MRSNLALSSHMIRQLVGCAEHKSGHSVLNTTTERAAVRTYGRWCLVGDFLGQGARSSEAPAKARPYFRPSMYSEATVMSKREGRGGPARQNCLNPHKYFRQN
jgi:hypothetical protein